MRDITFSLCLAVGISKFLYFHIGIEAESLDSLWDNEESRHKNNQESFERETPAGGYDNSIWKPNFSRSWIAYFQY